MRAAVVRDFREPLTIEERAVPPPGPGQIVVKTETSGLCHMLNGITVAGSIVGTRVVLAETFELHADGRTRVVRETRRLEDVNHCFDEVLGGAVDACLVFDLRF